MTVHACSKNAFTEDEKYQNLMTWLNLVRHKVVTIIIQSVWTDRSGQTPNKFEYWDRYGNLCAHNYKKNDEPFSYNTVILHEPPHDKTNKMTCVPSKLRSAWASAPSDQSLLCTQWVVKDSSFLHVDSEDTDQTDGCPGWSESLLGTHATLLVLSWGGWNNKLP